MGADISEEYVCGYCRDLNVSVIELTLRIEGRLGRSSKFSLLRNPRVKMGLESENSEGRK